MCLSVCLMSSPNWTHLWKGLIFIYSYQKRHTHDITLRQQDCYFYSLSVVKKVAHYMADVLEDSRDKVMENLLASGGKCGYCNRGVEFCQIANVLYFFFMNL